MNFVQQCISHWYRCRVHEKHNDGYTKLSVCNIPGILHCMTKHKYLACLCRRVIPAVMYLQSITEWKVFLLHTAKTIF